MTYAKVILPLPIEGTFTYRLPVALEGRVGVGFRVIVPFGPSKQYSGIVAEVSTTEPEGDFKIRDVIDILEDHPIVTAQQLKFWFWMANYYMCPIGDVYKAALPSGLRLASETILLPQEDFDSWAQLRPKEMQVLELLHDKKVKTVAQLSRAMKDNHVLSYVRNMIEKGAITIKESIENSFKPRKETHVRLTKKFFSEEALSQLFDELERTPKRYQLLMKYVELASVSSALTLHNPQLIQEVSRAALLKESGVSAAILVALRSKGILECYDYEIGRLSYTGTAVSQQLPLSPAQQEAFDQIQKEFETKSVCLLHGVTSSGKTEIYIRLIRQIIQQGGQVLYLLPEIALTTQITQRLRRIFGDNMGIYHSKFPDAERVEIWNKQLSDKPFNLILGVRSSLFLPFRNLKLIIVDEEHETSYKQEEPAPRYNARDAAIVLASQMGDTSDTKTLLGTATPSLETFCNARQERYGYVSLTSRYGEMQLPQIEIADVKELQRTKQMRLPFSPRLEEEISEALRNKEQVILFLNRRGYAPIVECPQCSWTPTCETCDVTLTYHQENHTMQCHYCGRSYPLPQACPNCGEKNLRSFGFGTEKIEEEVRKRFPNARTARLDMDTTRSRAAYENIINNFADGQTDILIGTQMVSKGLDFDNVHVVGILNADTMLLRPDFRSVERSFHMMSQVAGRAGRRNKRGFVILQTKHADYPVIQQIIDNNYLAMYEEQMEEREAFRYPPFYRLIYIYLKHRDSLIVEKAAQYFGQLLRERFSSRILGPDKPTIARVQLMFIRKIALKAERQLSPRVVRANLREAQQQLMNIPAFNALQIYFDVDPL